MKTVLQMILRSFFNPITLVNIFAPFIILQINYLKLGTILSRDSYVNNPYYSGLADLVTKNKWADTLVDINIQYVVLLVAFVFTIIESFKGIFAILKNHTVNDIITKWSESNGALLYLLVSLLVIAVGIIAFLSGGIISPEQINLYKVNSETATITFFGMHLPPFTSYIFIARLIISIYGVYLTYFLKNILPQVLDEKSK